MIAKLNGKRFPRWKYCKETGRILTLKEVKNDN